MNEIFKKLKRKKFLTAACIAAGTGVAAGLIAAGSVLLALKLSEININAGWYVLIGLGVAAIAGGVAFWVLLPTDKKVAKEIDREHALNEKVQTMVAFAGDDGDMVELQRQDAEEKLRALPNRKPPFKSWWKYLVAPVLALAIFLPAVILPGAGSSQNHKQPEKEFNYSQRQAEALNQLIKDNEKSSLANADKTAVSTLLKTLENSLGDIKTERVMKSAVLSTVSFVDLQLFTPNSFDNVAYQLKKDDKTKLLAAALTEGVGFYKANTARFTKFEQVEEAEKGLVNSVRGKVAENTDALREEFRITFEDGVVEYIQSVNEIVTEALKAAKIDLQDLIKLQLEKFTKNAAAAVENVAGMNDEAFQRDRVNKIFETFADDLTGSLTAQSYNCIMDEYIRVKLVTIFEIDSSELPALDSGVRDEDGNIPDDEDEEDDRNPSGGIGNGDIIYGGNDNLYHVDTGTLSPYGDKIDEYYDIILRRIQDGEIDEETAAIIENYFQILYGGVKRPEEQD
ncbi:MAG: hypothetical protein HFE41_04510 [Clostridia bacterium]|jgi:hypothetical protein|nr:hypothetical protein [Clostridia bacterium]